MTSDPDPKLVAQRLEALAALSRPETVDEARARLIADELAPDVFPWLVQQRLEVLRGLDDLMRYLQPARETLNKR